MESVCCFASESTHEFNLMVIGIIGYIFLVLNKVKECNIHNEDSPRSKKCERAFQRHFARIMAKAELPRGNGRMVRQTSVSKLMRKGETNPQCIIDEQTIDSGTILSAGTHELHWTIAGIRRRHSTLEVFGSR